MGGFLEIPRCSFDRKIWEAFSYSMCSTAVPDTAAGEMMDEKTTVTTLKKKSLSSSTLAYQRWQYLIIHGWDKLKSAPHQLQHLTALTILCIRDFKD